MGTIDVGHLILVKSQGRYSRGMITVLYAVRLDVVTVSEYGKMLEAKMEQIEQLERKRKELFHKLRRSMAIRDLWEEAFDGGRCHSRVEGNQRQLYFIIRDKSGEERKWKLEDVREILWPPEIRKEKLERKQGLRRRK